MLTIERYQDVIVFIVGGGCYSEFYNLQVCTNLQRSVHAFLFFLTKWCSELLRFQSIFDNMYAFSVYCRTFLLFAEIFLMIDLTNHFIGFVETETIEWWRSSSEYYLWVF